MYWTYYYTCTRRLLQRMYITYLFIFSSEPSCVRPLISRTGSAATAYRIEREGRRKKHVNTRTQRTDVLYTVCARCTENNLRKKHDKEEEEKNTRALAQSTLKSKQNQTVAKIISPSRTRTARTHHNLATRRRMAIARHAEERSVVEPVANAQQHIDQYTRWRWWWWWWRIKPLQSDNDIRSASSCTYTSSTHVLISSRRLIKPVRIRCTINGGVFYLLTLYTNKANNATVGLQFRDRLVYLVQLLLFELLKLLRRVRNIKWRHFLWHSMRDNRFKGGTGNCNLVCCSDNIVYMENMETRDSTKLFCSWFVS